MMGFKTFLIFSYTLIILISLVCSSNDPSPNSGRKISAKPYGFIKNFTGCTKGEKVANLHSVKSYLGHFGYMNNNQTLDDDDFDDNLESAVKTYQNNYHLNVTGSLDNETVSNMIKPRCGVPDIINGTNRMQNGNRKHDSNDSSSFQTVAHYKFFPGNPKWVESRYRLTYAFQFNMPSQVTNCIGRAFQAWAKNSQFKFTLSKDYNKADIRIDFVKSDHGDGIPFDGQGGTLAHAYSPQDGRFHFDAEENWVEGAVPNGYDLETVALHEIGHLLGLEHSSVPEAIMYPTLFAGVTKGLHSDDIQGIRALYNLN